MNLLGGVFIWKQLWTRGFSWEVFILALSHPKPSNLTHFFSYEKRVQTSITPKTNKNYPKTIPKTPCAVFLLFFWGGIWQRAFVSLLSGTEPVVVVSPWRWRSESCRACGFTMPKCLCVRAGSWRGGWGGRLWLGVFCLVVVFLFCSVLGQGCSILLNFFEQTIKRVERWSRGLVLGSPEQHSRAWTDVFESYSRSHSIWQVSFFLLQKPWKKAQLQIETRENRLVKPFVGATSTKKTPSLLTKSSSCCLLAALLTATTQGPAIIEFGFARVLDDQPMWEDVLVNQHVLSRSVSNYFQWCNWYIWTPKIFAHHMQATRDASHRQHVCKICSIWLGQNLKTLHQQWRSRWINLIYMAIRNKN